MILTQNERLVYSELVKHGFSIFVSPTELAKVKSSEHHSAWASPICKSLVERGLVVRNSRGHYAAVSPFILAKTLPQEAIW